VKCSLNWVIGLGIMPSPEFDCRISQVGFLLKHWSGGMPPRILLVGFSSGRGMADFSLWGRRSRTSVASSCKKPVTVEAETAGEWTLIAMDESVVSKEDGSCRQEGKPCGSRAMERLVSFLRCCFDGYGVWPSKESSVGHWVSVILRTSVGFQVFFCNFIMCRI